jgi:uncharacterized protein YndB with AHSA1/START domain
MGDSGVGRGSGRVGSERALASGDALVVEADLPASRESVWRAVTVDECRQAWWPYLELDATPGGRFIERWRDAAGRDRVTSGVVLGHEPPVRLRLSWRDEDWSASTVVTLTLEARGGITRAQVRHCGWHALGVRGADLRADHLRGWEMHLANLRAYIGKDGGEV